MARHLRYCLTAVFLTGLPLLSAQTPARILTAIDQTQRVTLTGNTPAFVRSANDRGALAPAQLLQRVLLVLRRSPRQDADLRLELDSLRERDSPNYHRWLSPLEFGRQFGPASADIATITDWLRSSGFTVNRIAQSGQVIEFSGNAVGGQGGATASLIPAMLAFGSVNVGQSNTQNFTLSAAGSGSFSVTRVTFTMSSLNAALNPDYSSPGTCLNAVSAGDSCTIPVTFTPSVAGADSALVTVYDHNSSIAFAGTSGAHTYGYTPTGNYVIVVDAYAGQALDFGLVNLSVR